MTRHRVAVPESAVLKACLQILQHHPKIGLAWRCNVGGMQNGSGKWVKFGFKGQSDLMAILKPSGRLLAVECKRKGKCPTEAQEAFLEAVRQAGGVSWWVDDVQTLADYLSKV